ncbi:hypothetical protein ASPCAL08399 [Aspergillus calidoustus]|uniref:Zn(2)-C6 fungal-type domain-containing protein n=1 Tax=Aspergillus calidoustus TaxID=454130 RepID=A0A0U5GSH7_ASPCI|nr:hypothetical protein ASPCAL08399 [Aspergillus calidoustus]
MPFPQVGLVPRRRKVGHACNFCREHRVRCEAVTPCPPCEANNVPCVRTRLQTPQTPRRNRSNGTKGSNESCRRQQKGTHSADTLLEDLQPVEESSPPTPSPSANLAWTSQKTDSILGFIARINAFCSGGQQQYASTASSGDTPFGQDLPFLSGVQETQASDCDLSPAQTGRIMQTFWSHLRPLMPIVQWDEVNPERMNRALQPLQDAVTVYTLQYIHNSSLHTRLAGLNWPQFQHWKSKIGLPYFQRALSAVTQLATFARPSVPVMQCYCYLTLYLLDAGQYQAAYIMVGLGLRIAQSLNYMDSRNGWYKECRPFRHVWWTLIHLEFRCARHVGKPVTSRADGLVGLGPSREELDMDCSSGLSYHIESIRLTAVARAINEAMDLNSPREGISGLANIEARAEVLLKHLDLLKLWRDELPRQEPFANLQLDAVETTKTSPQPGDALSTPQDTLAGSPILALQNTLLSLQYHNTTMTLHRTFIQFPSTSSSSNSNSSNPTSKSTTHALTALHHAITLTTLTHTRLSTHDIHHGHAEIYQYQWNAVITIIGFMLAYPFRRELCAWARGCLDLAMEVFTSAGGDAAAKRAAVLTGYLGRKVDGLVGGQDGQHITPDPPPFHPPTSATTTTVREDSEEEHPLQSRTSEPAHPVALDQAVSTATTATTPIALNTPNSPFLSTDGQPLWLWDELGNLDAWPTYCDEAFEAFMVDPEDSFA